MILFTSQPAVAGVLAVGVAAFFIVCAAFLNTRLNFARKAVVAAFT
jgi:hypothetical protein